MEKITRKPLSEIEPLAVLHTNWEKWGAEYARYLETKKQQGTAFSWRGGIYTALREQLSAMTAGHCTFCDGHPIGATSKETIEHYHPKTEFPLIAYQWENHYYCCDQCQSESNKQQFQESLRPDAADYAFDAYFYYDPSLGEVKVLENLPPDLHQRATTFLDRYGINCNPHRIQARKNCYKDIKNYLKDPLADGRLRDDFPYRWVYDSVVLAQTHP